MAVDILHLKRREGVVGQKRESLDFRSPEVYWHLCNSAAFRISSIQPHSSNTGKPLRYPTPGAQLGGGSWGAHDPPLVGLLLSKQPTIFRWRKRHDNILAIAEKPTFLKFVFCVKYFRQRLLSLVNMGLHAAIIRLSLLIHEGEQRYKPYIVGWCPCCDPPFETTPLNTWFVFSQDPKQLTGFLPMDLQAQGKRAFSQDR